MQDLQERQQNAVRGAAIAGLRDDVGGGNRLGKRSPPAMMLRSDDSARTLRRRNRLRASQSVVQERGPAAQ